MAPTTSSTANRHMLLGMVEFRNVTKANPPPDTTRRMGTVVFRNLGFWSFQKKTKPRAAMGWAHRAAMGTTDGCRKRVASFVMPKC